MYHLLPLLDTQKNHSASYRKTFILGKMGPIKGVQNIIIIIKQRAIRGNLYKMVHSVTRKFAFALYFFSTTSENSSGFKSFQAICCFNVFFFYVSISVILILNK